MYIAFVPDAGIGIADKKPKPFKFFEEPLNKIVLVQHKLPICQNFFEYSGKG